MTPITPNDFIQMSLVDLDALAYALAEYSAARADLSDKEDERCTATKRLIDAQNRLERVLL